MKFKILYTIALVLILLNGCRSIQTASADDVPTKDVKIACIQYGEKLIQLPGCDCGCENEDVTYVVDGPQYGKIEVSPNWGVLAYQADTCRRHKTDVFEYKAYRGGLLGNLVLRGTITVQLVDKR